MVSHFIGDRNPGLHVHHACHLSYSQTYPTNLYTQSTVFNTHPTDFYTHPTAFHANPTESLCLLSHCSQHPFHQPADFHTHSTYLNCQTLMHPTDIHTTDQSDHLPVDTNFHTPFIFSHTYPIHSHTRPTKSLCRPTL